LMNGCLATVLQFGLGGHGAPAANLAQTSFGRQISTGFPYETSSSFGLARAPIKCG
jgi:hypothetical protein